MKVLSNNIEGREALLTIELEPAEVEDSLQKSYKKIVKKTAIPGFRKGKAPRSVLEQHIGKDELLEDALNSLIPEACANAIKENDIEPIAQPSIKLMKKEPVTFEARVPLPPVVELGDYYKIKMKPEKVKIKEEEINSVIEELRQRNATYKPVERPVQVNDMVTINVEGVAGEETMIDKKNIDYHVISGITYPAPGFPEKLLKMKRDKEKEFSLKLSKNYHKKELAEKEVLFKVKILEIKEEILPEINDDFVKSLGPGIENIEELKKEIKENLKSSAEGKAMASFEDTLIETLIEKSELEYPSMLVDMEANNLVVQYLQQLRMSVKDQGQYEQMLEKMPRDEIINRYRPLAIKRVSGNLVLQKVARAENIEVKDDEIDAEIEQITQDAGDGKNEQKKYYNSPRNRDYIKNVLTMQKTVQRLVDIAQSTKKENTKQKEAK